LSTSFPAEPLERPVVIEERIIEIEYPDRHAPNLRPILHDHGYNSFELNEVDNAVQFRHRQLDDTINNHEGDNIAIDTLFRQMLPLHQNPAGAKYRRCWKHPLCQALMFPYELRYILDLARPRLTPENIALYEENLQNYTRLFGRNFETNYPAIFHNL
jgi:hypothetical protein